MFQDSTNKTLPILSGDLSLISSEILHPVNRPSLYIILPSSIFAFLCIAYSKVFHHHPRIKSCNPHFTTSSTATIPIPICGRSTNTTVVIEKAKQSRYIETFYNTVRIHSHCRYLSPNEYEEQYLKNLETDVTNLAS
ncbi:MULTISPECIES: IS3 family transposase [Lachnospiraceae]|uniref:IS3 family transposase n=1 Tax=Coprococcus TaxID=33042 RepID=UPI003A87FD05